MEEIINIYLSLIKRLVEIGVQDIQEGNVAEDPALQLEQAINKLKEEIVSHQGGGNLLH